MNLPDADSRTPAHATSWPHVLNRLIGGSSLTGGEAAWAMDRIMSGQAADAQVAGFLVALRAKGVGVGELTGLVESMLSHALPFQAPPGAVDIVGTGGDRLGTVNVSTMAALVIAATGTPVVKHGNRAASSSSGSADVLEALGVNLSLSADQVGQVARDTGIGFCFAQVFHPSMRFAAPARKALGVPTAFNLLGPLTNPAQPAASAIGVADADAAPLMAGVLARRGRKALVFRGDDGLDELTTTGPSRVWAVSGGQVRQTVFDPADLGVPRATVDQLRGADASHNAGIARDMLSGKAGAVRDIVLVNAAAGLTALQVDQLGAHGGQPENHAELRDRLTQLMEHNHRRAAAAVDSGAAAALLERWAAATNNLS